MALPKYHNTLYVLLLCTFCLLSPKASADSAGNTQNWLNHGGDLYNRRYANKEKKIHSGTVSTLNLKWKFYTGSDMSVTPAIFNNTLYFPSWNGYLYAVKTADGSLIWKQNLQNLTGFNNPGFTFNVNSTVSRSTPTVAGDLLIVGLWGPAVVVAVKRSNGKLVWKTKLDDHDRSLLTMSGTYYRGAYYIGTSSMEEGLTFELCCTFRGSLAKLDAKTGWILWQTFMLPDNFGKIGEYAGAAIWGSSPSIDPIRNHVYIATEGTSIQLHFMYVNAKKKKIIKQNQLVRTSVSNPKITPIQSWHLT